MITALAGAEAPLLPGEPGQVSLAEARAYDPQPTWNRQDPVAWAMIREEYQAGATAKQLGVKWRMSPTSIYRHAYQEGWSKKALAKQVAKAALARAAVAEDEAVARLDAEVAAEAAPPPPLEDEPDTPEALRALTLAALARRLRSGEHTEAERLGKLAETLGKMIPPPPPALPTRMPEDALAAVYTEPEGLDPLDGDPEEVKTLALAAIAKALRAGRYADAERLGKLAESLSRMSAAAPPPAAPPASPQPDEEWMHWTEEETEAVRTQLSARFGEIAKGLEEAGILEEVIALAAASPA